jgi:hypothetical protein
MSKFLLNLLLQISGALVYSKIKLLFGKEFFLTFGPIRAAASQPIRPFDPAAAHFFSFQLAVPPPLPTRPRPLGRPSSPSRPNRPSSSSSCTGAKCTSRCRWPASRRPTVNPDDIHRKENNGRITPPSFPHSVAPFPLFNPW